MKRIVIILVMLIAVLAYERRIAVWCDSGVCGVSVDVQR